MELRQAKTTPSTTDAYRFMDKFAMGEMWTSSTGVFQEIARQLRHEEGQVHTGSYGCMKAQCDIRRGQFQAILNYFKIPWDEFEHNQDTIGQTSLYHPSVRNALKEHLGPDEAYLLPKMPQELKEALEKAEPLGVDWEPVPIEAQNKLTQSLQEHGGKSIGSNDPGPHPSSFLRPST